MIVERERMGRETQEWRRNYERIEVSNGELDRTMKMMLADKLGLERQL